MGTPIPLPLERKPLRIDADRPRESETTGGARRAFAIRGCLLLLCLSSPGRGTLGLATLQALVRLPGRLPLRFLVLLHCFPLCLVGPVQHFLLFLGRFAGLARILLRSHALSMKRDRPGNTE